MKGCDHMIYTVTLNPALDYVVHAVSLHTGVVQRATSAKLLPAGKGVNVSLLLHGLGCPTRAVGIKAGWTGDAVESGLRAIGCAGPFFPQEEGMTRINVKLRHGMETDVNLPGPAMEPAAWNDLCTWLKGLESGDTVVFSGSVPPPLGKDAYADLIRCLPKGVRAAVDTEGDRLLQTLPLQPFLIKPNHEELGAIFHTEIKTYDDAVLFGEKLRKQGAQNVLISMGKMGAVLVSRDGDWKLEAPTVEVQNTAGAGDSSLAGFLYGYDTAEGDETERLQAGLRWGVAAGSATAASEGIAAGDTVRDVFARTAQPESIG